jgi:uncharacterized protein YaaN involved in tellurite resistance
MLYQMIVNLKDSIDNLTKRMDDQDVWINGMILSIAKMKQELRKEE